MSTDERRPPHGFDWAPGLGAIIFYRRNPYREISDDSKLNSSSSIYNVYQTICSAVVMGIFVLGPHIATYLLDR